MNTTMIPESDGPGAGFMGEICLSTAIATLFRELWPFRGYDQALHTGLVGAMAALRRDGMKAVGVAGRITGRSLLYRFVPTVRKEVESEIRRSFESRVQTSDFLGAAKDMGPYVFGIVDDGAGSRTIAVVRRFPLRDAQGGLLPTDDQGGNYCAIFVRIARKGVSEVVRASWEQFCSEAVVPMLFDLFRHRERRMMPFAPAVSKLYWEEASKSKTPPAFRPPWDEGEAGDGRAAMRETVTLSVDLRKSTFCMDQAESQPEFGRWLDKLVQVLISVCHRHGGVFDKFTGDGGLLHFLDRECRACGHAASIEAAFRCAIDLSAAVDSMLPDLRRNLRNNSGRLGAGIAIAVSEAFWSVDHRDNPIVVGHGVVDACRICDGTPPRTIRMANLAYHRLAIANPPSSSLFAEVDLGQTKEWTPEMKLKVWQMTRG